MDTSNGQKKAVLEFRGAFKSAPWIPISSMQALSFRERPLRGSVLVSKVKIPVLGDEDGESLRSKLWEVFKSKCEGVEKLDYPAPCASYDGEWIGVRKNVTDPKAPQPNISEEDKYRCIQRDHADETVLFYISGGAWFRAGPPGARPLIKQLCETSGYKAFTFQYRLVPQYTIPTLLLDTLVAYFYLLSPPLGSLHKPIHPKNIIMVGESGGANLHFSVLQFIQSLSRSASDPTNPAPTIHINGRGVSLEMPGGCAFVSPGGDLSLSLPSVKEYESIDWLSEGAPWLQPKFPADTIWPSDPPRGDLHCDNSALCHPMVSPSTWTDWKGMPPMWIACGQETYSDGIKYLVKNIKASGIPVTFVEYEYMPHVWNVVIPSLPQSRHCTKLWGEACKTFGAAARINDQNPSPEAWLVKLGKLEMVEQSFERLLDVLDDEVLRRMRTARDELAGYVWMGSAIGYAKL